jgi:hypothetical protein
MGSIAITRPGHSGNPDPAGRSWARADPRASRCRCRGRRGRAAARTPRHGRPSRRRGIRVVAEERRRRTRRRHHLPRHLVQVAGADARLGRGRDLLEGTGHNPAGLPHRFDLGVGTERHHDGPPFVRVESSCRSW